MNGLLQDIRYAFRLLMKSPAFTFVAVLTVGLGIGVNTAMFSVINGVVLEPLAYPAPERLVGFNTRQSYPDVRDFQQQARSFKEVGLYGSWLFDMVGSGEPQQVEGAIISGSLLEVFATQPQMGRLLNDADDKPGAEPVVVISDRFWKRHLDSDPAVLSRAVNLSGKQYRIVGVMPPGFEMPAEEVEIWTAFQVTYPEAAEARGAHFTLGMARLADGASIEQAQAELDTIAANLGKLYPEENKDRRFPIVGLHEWVVGDIRSTMLALMGAVGLVLLIACANFANLLIAKSATRQQEIAVRTAIGATPARIIRLLMTESALLALIGGALGVLLAFWCIDALRALEPSDVPRLQHVAVNLKVLGFAGLVSLLTGMLFGLFPAFQVLRTNLSETLKEGGRTGAAGIRRTRMRQALVVSELALCLVLLVGAGLLLRSFAKMQQNELGFNPEGLLTLRITLPAERYAAIPTQVAFTDRLLEQMNRIPEVRSAAFISELPLSGNRLTHNTIVAGMDPVPPGEEPEVNARMASAGYLETMGIPLKQGRYLDSNDRENTLRVAVVNESFVREFLPGKNPIGAQARWARGPADEWMTIVGVVGDIRHASRTEPEGPTIYFPYTQNAAPWRRWMVAVIKPREGEAMGVLGAAKDALWKVDSQLPVSRVFTMEEVMARSASQSRFNLLLLGLFSTMALILAVIGLYGVMSYLVTQRTHEIGVRMALGAQPLDVLRLVMGQGMTLLAIGAVLGIAGAFAATRLLATMLYEVTPTDPISIAGTVALLTAVALLACYVPARRAAQVQPIQALRYE